MPGSLPPLRNVKTHERNDVIALLRHYVIGGHMDDRRYREARNSDAADQDG